MNGKRVVSMVLVLVIVLVGIVYNLNNYTFASERITLEPTIYDETGVDVNSEFTLSVVEQRKLEEIKNSLAIIPHVEYEIVKKREGQYTIKFKEELKRNSIYTFNLALEGFNSSWAFQTQKEFNIIGSFPRDKSQRVPVNSGIEIMFSHREIANINDYFEILPKVDGKFEYHKNTVVFVPKKLEPETLYTVNIKKGLQLKNSEQKLKDDFTFQFETDTKYDEKKEVISFTDILPEFSTSEKPVLNVVYYNQSRRSSEEEIDKNIDVNVYKYKSYDDLMNVLKDDEKPYWSLYSRDYKDNLENLDLIKSFNTDLVRDLHNYYLMLPDILQEGYYLVEGKKGENTFYSHIQVTNISAYYSESDSKNLVWVHDLDNKKPLEGAEIKVNDKTFSTDKNGIAVYNGNIQDEKSNNDIRFIKISKDNMNPLILKIYPQFVPYGSFFYPPLSNEHLSYVFLDRNMYKPGDLLNFWGIIKSLKNENIDKITVTLEKGYWHFDENYLMKKEVYLNEDGTFEEQFNLPNLNEGYYKLTFREGEKIITTNSIEIKRYEKPEYKLEIKSDKKAIFLGEDINFEVEASFFEGTPVSNLEINYNIDGFNNTIMTDNDGKVSLSYKPDRINNPSNYSYYQHKNLFINSRLPEIADIKANQRFYVYTKDQMITAKSEVENNKGKVTINLNDIDLSKINNSKEEFNYYDNQLVLGKPVENKELEVKLIKTEWEKIEDGVRYDFINKKTVKKYRYETKEITLETKSLITDSNGQVNYEFNMEEDGRYNVEVDTVDSKGRKIHQSVYISNWTPYYYDLQKIELKSDKNEYSIGEEVKLSFLEADKPIEHTGDILFITAQNGILDYKLINKQGYEFNFKKEHIPNLYVYGIAFNGKTYKVAMSPSIRINPLDKEIKIEINSDKDSYKPGEDVVLDINVLDRLNNPVSARVNISIVDEAFFSLREQNVNILQGLFKNIAAGITRTYASHNKSEYGGLYGPELFNLSRGAIDEGNGSDMSSQNLEDGSKIRSEFKDTAIFKTVQTDAQGKGKISFTLPHNITDWRVTYQGVTHDLNAGNGNINISATLPFFLQTVLNDTYLEGDVPIIAVNSHGLELEQEELVEYEIAVPSLGINQFKKITGEAFKNAYFKLPKLTLGEHKVIIKAKSNKGFVDAIEKTLKVVPTYHTEIVNKYYELTNNLKLTGSEDGITNLVFNDLNRGKYYYDLTGLKYSYGLRVDQQVSGEIAKDLLEKFFDEENNEDDNSKLNQYQLNDGGISLLPYSESNIELTAKIADLAQDKFDKSMLLQYFNSKAEERLNEAVILYGKTSLGEMVLNELNRLSKINNLSVKDKLYIALAYEKSGHKEAAFNILDDILKENTESNEAYIRIDKGIDKDDMFELTSLAMVLASRLNIEEKEMLYEYVKYHNSEYILVNLEKLMYLKEEISKLPNIASSFKYQLGDKLKEISLENGLSYRMSVTKESLENLTFSDIKGSIAVNVRYETVKNDLAGTKDKYVSVTREYYTLEGEKTNTFNSTDIVKVVLYPNIDNNAFNGIYEVTDILPAGLKPIENYWDRNLEHDKNSIYPWDIEGQQVKFYTHTSFQHKNRPMVYYARVISKGEYNCEQAVIKNITANDIATYSERSKIIIK